MLQREALPPEDNDVTRGEIARGSIYENRGMFTHEPSEIPRYDPRLLRFCYDARLATSPLALEHNTNCCRLGVITKRGLENGALLCGRRLTILSRAVMLHSSFHLARSFSRSLHVFLPLYAYSSPILFFLPSRSLVESLSLSCRPSVTHTFFLSLSLSLFSSISFSCLSRPFCLSSTSQLHLALHLYSSVYLIFWISRCISFESAVYKLFAMFRVEFRLHQGPRDTNANELH